MKKPQIESFWCIRIRVNDSRLFSVRAERFAFLNVWRTYFSNTIKTCAYVLLPSRFETVTVIESSAPVHPERLKSFIQEKLEAKLRGIFSEDQISVLCGGLEVEQLFTEKECIYKTFDLHTMPQKFGHSTDYRTYPFSSFKALSGGFPTQLDQQRVWSWFGGQHRFSIFHQAYYGWIKPETGSETSTAYTATA
jgi:hypothetical protein